MSAKSRQNLMMYIVIITMVAVTVIGMVTLYGYHIREWFQAAPLQNVQSSESEGLNEQSVGVEHDKNELRKN